MVFLDNQVQMLRLIKTSRALKVYNILRRIFPALIHQGQRQAEHPKSVAAALELVLNRARRYLTCLPLLYTCSITSAYQLIYTKTLLPHRILLKSISSQGFLDTYIVSVFSWPRDPYPKFAQ